MGEQSLEVVKWYTRARRFPQLIGKTPDGARIGAVPTRTPKWSPR